MMNKMKQKLEILKNAIKSAISNKEQVKKTQDDNAFTSKLINLEARIINIERENEDLKVALGNMSIAFLELMKSLPVLRGSAIRKTSNEDEGIEKLLRAFNSEQNDDDLIN